MLLNSFLLPIHGEPNSLALLNIVEAHKQIVEVAFFPCIFLAYRLSFKAIQSIGLDSPGYKRVAYTSMLFLLRAPGQKATIKTVGKPNKTLLTKHKM